MSHYETLGVPTTATQEEIEAAFEEWKRTHPLDTTADPASAVITAKYVVEAYRVLHDRSRREEYDRILEWQMSVPKNAAISEEEFRSWLNTGTISEGLAAKVETERGLRSSGDLAKPIRTFRDRGGLLLGLFAVQSVLFFWLEPRAGVMAHLLFPACTAIASLLLILVGKGLSEGRRDWYLRVGRFIGGSVAWLAGIVAVVFIFWAFLRGVRWLWDHPIW